MSALKGEILRSLEFYPPRETRLFLEKVVKGREKQISSQAFQVMEKIRQRSLALTQSRKTLSANSSGARSQVVYNGSRYSGDHPQVARLCQKAIFHLQETMEGQAGISFMGIDGAIVCEGDRIDDNLFMNRFAQTLKDKGVEHVEFQRGITCQELQAFITSLVKKKSGSPAGFAAPHIRLGKIDVAMTQSAASDLRRQVEKEGLLDVPLAELDLLKEIFTDVKRQKNLRVVGIQEIVAAWFDSVRQEAIPLQLLTAHPEPGRIHLLPLAQCLHSQFSPGHGYGDRGAVPARHRDRRLAPRYRQALHSRRGSEQTRKIERLGKYYLIREHPLKGAQYLMAVSGTPRLAVVTAFEHHMKFNHTGYPEISADWKQNLCSQMTTVSDFFDALHTHRSYRSSLDVGLIRALMQERSGQEFNPLLMENFFKILHQFKPEAE